MEINAIEHYSTLQCVQDGRNKMNSIIYILPNAPETNVNQTGNVRITSY
jgi:hypothetical protein